MSNEPAYEADFPDRKTVKYGDTEYICSLKETEDLAADNDCFIQSGENWFWIINEMKNAEDVPVGDELMERLEFDAN